MPIKGNRLKKRHGELSGYLICTSPRSGSSYLCRLLASTGRLGYPREYFNLASPAVWRLDPAYPADPGRQIEFVLREGVTPNGIYGAKLFANQFDGLAAYRLAERLPNLKYIRLRRDDLLGQAISHVRAQQTGKWSSTGKSSRSARYDRGAIARHIARIAKDEARWSVFFARNGISPLPLAYHDVMSDPQGAVNAVAAYLHVQGPVEIDWQQVRSKIMRDQENEDWREQFVRDMADTSRLDSLAGLLSWHPLARRGRSRVRRAMSRLMLW